MPDIETMVREAQERRQEPTAPSDPETVMVDRLFELLCCLEIDYHRCSGRPPQAYLVGGRWWNNLTAAAGILGLGRTFFFRRVPVHHVELPGLQTLVGVAE